jgi:hypothetical protein
MLYNPSIRFRDTTGLAGGRRPFARIISPLRRSLLPDNELLAPSLCTTTPVLEVLEVVRHGAVGRFNPNVVALLDDPPSVLAGLRSPRPDGARRPRQGKAEHRVLTLRNVPPHSERYSTFLTPCHPRPTTPVVARSCSVPVRRISLRRAGSAAFPPWFGGEHPTSGSRSRCNCCCRILFYLWRTFPCGTCGTERLQYPDC